MSSTAELKEMMNRKRAAREQERISKGEASVSSKVEEIKKNKKMQRAKTITNALLMDDDDDGKQVAGYKRATPARTRAPETIDTSAVLETAAQRRQAGIRNILLREGFFDDPPPNTLPPGVVVLEPMEQDAAQAHLTAATAAIPKPSTGLSTVASSATKVELKMEVIRMQKELAEEHERKLTSSTMLEAEQEWADSRARDDAAASLEGKSLLEKIKARRDALAMKKPQPIVKKGDEESESSDEDFSDWRMSKR